MVRQARDAGLALMYLRRIRSTWVEAVASLINSFL